MTPASMPLPADERRQVPGPDPGWWESWDFDFATPGASLGGYVRLDLLPHQGACGFAAAVVGQHRDLVTVADQDVGLPRPPTLEIRSEGLWADLIVEDPLDHVSVGCEAFALRLDDAADALTIPLLGERTPFGLDLGWETEGPITPTPSGYAVPCRVVGEVLVADERIELDASGWRRHSWGVAASGEGSRLWTRGRWADATWLHDDGADDRVDGGATRPPGAAWKLDLVAQAPTWVPRPAADGVRLGRLVRSLGRLVDPTSGRTGAAWSDHGP